MSSLTFAFKTTSFVPKLAFARKRTQGVEAVSMPMTGAIHGLTFVYIWAVNTNVSKYLWYSLKGLRHAICHLSTKVKSKYSGTPLIRSPMGQKNWPYYRGWFKFHNLRAVMTNTPYIAFAFLEQLFSLRNNRNVVIAYSNWKNKNTFSKFSFST